MACAVARAERASCAVTRRCSCSVQPHGVSPPTLRDSQMLHVHQLPTCEKGHRHPETYHSLIVTVNQRPGVLPFPRGGSPARRSAVRQSPAAVTIKSAESIWGEGWGWRWTVQSPSLCRSGPHGRDAAMCPGALASPRRWVVWGDAWQRKTHLRSLLVCFLLFLARLDVSWPCHLIRFWSFSSTACVFFKAFCCQSWPLLRERKSSQQTSLFKNTLV